MNADQVRGALAAAGELSAVAAVHDAVVLDVACPDDDAAHTVMVCAACQLVDVDDEDCPRVVPVIHVVRGLL